MKYILTFDEINEDNKHLVGGKGKNLGKLFNAGFDVPDGFVVTTKGYEEFFKKNYTKEFEEEIKDALSKFNTEKFAVRSSATAEDLPTTSFAGQHDSFLNVKKEDVIEAIVKCWKSLFTERAVFYRKQNKIDKTSMAVVVQEMVPAEYAGVMFTVDPIEHKDILIEAVSGLGEKLVSGQVTPNNYFVDRKTFSIKRHYEEEDISEELIKSIAKEGMKIEEHYGSPQDIEFTVIGKRIRIVQSRPITT